MSTLSDRIASPTHDIHPTRHSLTSSPWADVIRAPRPRPDAIVAAALIRTLERRLPFRLSHVSRGALGQLGTNLPTVMLHRPKTFYRRLAKDGLIGLGESYQAGDWDCDDLAGLLTIFASHLDDLVPSGLNWIKRFHGPRRGRQSADVLADTRRDISHHYDLPDELFSLFLDQTMTYSCALFDTDLLGHPIATVDSLQAAQESKIDRLLDLAHVGDGSRVLEIGTGWGELATRAAERGAHVLSVTLSEAQQRFAAARIAQRGMADRVGIELWDYREIEGRLRAGGKPSVFDAIVSVEMLEHVGEQYWPAYFSALDRMLAPNGRIALQTSTMSHHAMITTRHKHTWLHKYVFPGFLVPSITAIERCLRQHTSVRIMERYCIAVTTSTPSGCGGNDSMRMRRSCHEWALMRRSFARGTSTWLIVSLDFDPAISM